jgi:Tfp pilus assembly protein PilX
MKTKTFKDEKGIALVLSILLLLIVTLIGISAVNTTTFDLLISGNKKASDQAFYVAEAGINEFLGRFRSDATNVINDNTVINTPPTPTPETDPPWRIFLAKSSGMGATQLGAGDEYTTSVTSLQTQLDFGVEVKHKVNTAGNLSTYNNKPIYITKSYGYTSDGGNKAIEVEIKVSLLDPPAALYTENPANIKGASTYIQGNDQCGTNNKPGILTTLPSTDPIAVDTTGGPTIIGTPNIRYSGENLDLQEAVNHFKKDANFSYNYTGNETKTGLSWGSPTFVNTTTPLTYTGNPNIVYFNMQGNKTIKLAGGTSGAGILIVNGNLELNGGFTWYGIVIVTGALDFTGGGEKNVTGGILAGESATIEIDVAGNAGIIYCSSVANWLQGGVSPFMMTRWRDIF